MMTKIHISLVNLYPANVENMVSP